MKSEARKPLKLTRETVRTLPESSLEKAVGGTGGNPPPTVIVGDPDMPTGD